MSELKPGWAEELGRQQAGDTEADSRMRRRGQRPFQENPFNSRHREANAKAHRSQRLDRVLGPITED